MANPLAEAFVRIRPNSAGFGKEMKSQLDAQGGAASASGAKAGESFASGMKSKVSKLAKDITIGTVGAAAAIGVASVDMAAKFQTGLNTLVTSAGEAQKNLGLVGDGIKKIAVQSGTSTSQLVTGMYQIESAGYHGAAGLKVLTAAAEGAKSENSDLGTVTNAVTTVMNDFHLGAGQATQAMNGLIGITSHGKTTLQLLAASMSKVLPTAASLGLSFGDVGGAMATMTGEGVTARLAATHLNSTLLALAAPNAVAAKAMNVMGLSAKDAAKYQEDLAKGNTTAAAKILNMGHSADQVANTLQHHGLIAALSQIANLALNAGPRGSTAYVAAMKAMLGSTAGLAVGLQLTGKHLETTQANTRAVGQAFDDSSGKVHGFGLVTHSLGFQLDVIRQEIATTGISIGQKLIPPLTSLAEWASKNQGEVITFGEALAGLAITISGVYITVKTLSVISSVAGGFKAAGSAIKTFSAASTFAAGTEKALAAASAETTGKISLLAAAQSRAALAMKGTAAETATFAVGADGAAVAIGDLTLAEKAAAIAGAAMAAVNPLVWAVGGAAAIAGLTYLLLKNTDSISRSTDALAAQDKAVGYNIAGYKALASQTTAVAAQTGNLGRAVKATAPSYLSARVGAAAYAGAVGQVSQAHMQAAGEAVNLTNRLNSLEGLFGLTAKQAEELTSKAGFTGKQLGAVGDAGYRAYNSVIQYADGSGQAALKSIKLHDAAQSAADALNNENNALLAGQGNLLNWQEATQQATQAIKDSKHGLDGQSAAALNAKQQVYNATQAAIGLANQQAALAGGIPKATKTIQDQINWLQKHGDKSHFATVEIAALEAIEKKLKNIQQHIGVDAKGIYHVTSGSPAGQGKFIRNAAGGLIQSGTGPTSDDVPMLASRGEYVTKAASVAKYGTHMMDAINAGRFAEGGVVGGYNGTLSGIGQFFQTQTAATLKALDVATAAAAASAIKQKQSLSGAIPGGDLGAHGGSAAANQRIARQLLPLFGFGIGQMPALTALWNRESGWNQFAKNPSSGAYGIPQSLPADKMAAAGSDWLTNPATQERWGLSYIKGKYGNPAGAWGHETNFGWYDRGGMLQPGWTMAYNGTGKPEPVGAPSNAAVVQRLDVVIQLLARAPAATSRGVGAALSGTGRRAVARGQYPNRGAYA